MMSNENNLWIVKRSFSGGELPGNIRTLLFSANGFLGVQASLPEDSPSGTFINGFFETAPIVYGEKAYGYPSLQQVMIPLADVLGWRVSEKGPDGELPCIVSDGQIEVDMKRGIRTLISRIHTTTGQDLELKEEVLSSFTRPGVLLSRISISESKGSEAKGDGGLHSRGFRLTRRIAAPGGSEESHDPRKAEAFGHNVFAESSLEMKDSHFVIQETTSNSGLTYSCTLGLIAPGGTEVNPMGTEEASKKESLSSASADSTGRWEKEKCFEYECPLNGDGGKLRGKLSSVMAAAFSIDGNPAAPILESALAEGWDALAEEQEEYLRAFWRKGDMRFEKHPELTTAMRYCSYGLIQSVGTSAERSAAAKGLSSGGYNGHYFWDADIYVQGALNTLDPERAGSLVEYRISKLQEARERAAELSEKGALYPWRTIDGRECSAFFPAGTAQFHINADIIWGLKSYIENTGDHEILRKGGAEMLFETARFWSHFAHHVEGKGYCLYCVTGPDEYTALSDNNFYTNLMAREHLAFASECASKLADSDPAFWKELCGRISLDRKEATLWERIASAFYLPHDSESGVFMQDETFLEKKEWDWDATPEENRPLLLHYHPLKIYRHKVLKQPDVIMGMLLHRQYFNREEFRANFDYYDPLTSGDSSLSSAVQSAVAALAGRMKEGAEHFEKNLFLDLEDREENTDNGVHLASMAGARMAISYGFAGFRTEGEIPSLAPLFPEIWGRVSFSLLYRGLLLDVEYDSASGELKLTSEGDMKLQIASHVLQLKAGEEEILDYREI